MPVIPRDAVGEVDNVGTERVELISITHPQ